MGSKTSRATAVLKLHDYVGGGARSIESRESSCPRGLSPRYKGTESPSQSSRAKSQDQAPHEDYYSHGSLVHYGNPMMRGLTLVRSASGSSAFCVHTLPGTRTRALVPRSDEGEIRNGKS